MLCKKKFVKIEKLMKVQYNLITKFLFAVYGLSSCVKSSAHYVVLMVYHFVLVDFFFFNLVCLILISTT